MTGKLILRNTARNFRKSRPVLVIFAAAVALTLVGNSLLEAASSGYESFFRQGISGDYSVSDGAASEFTLFGSDALLVGEFHLPPVFPGFDEAREAVLAADPTALVAGVVTATARVEFGRSEENVFLFGIELDDFASFATTVEFLEGGWPVDPSQNYILLTDTRRKRIELESRQQVGVGTRLLLSSAANDSFSIREAVLAGIIDLPLEDQILERLAFTNASVARAMNGYLSSAGSAPAESDPIFDFLDADIESLLGGAGSSAQAAGTGELPESGGGSSEAAGDTSIFDLLGDLYLNEVGPEDGVGQIHQEPASGGAWNFLLVRSDKAAPAGLAVAGGLVRDWRASVGGQVLLLGLIQNFFNLGLVFVVLGSMLILSNSLALSVLERTREIGTMRALGASKQFVALVIGGEALFMVALATVVGVIFGALAAGILEILQVPLDNQLLRSLFAATAIRAQLSIPLVLAHLAGGVVLGLTALLVPVSRALQINPGKAMAA